MIPAVSISIHRGVEESEIGQGGSPDFLSGARGHVREHGQNRFFSPDVYNPVPDLFGNYLVANGVPRVISNTINDYVMQQPRCFGGAEWRKYFGVDVGNPVLPDEFVTWWSAPDAVDLLESRLKPQSNYETHLNPVYRPESVQVLSSGEQQAYDLQTLATLAANPLNGGDPTNMTSDTDAFKQHAKTPAGPGCWVIFRRELIGRGRSYDQQKNHIDLLNRKTGAKYERKNSLLDLATAIVVRQVSKEEHHLGNYINIGRLARCRDLVRFNHETLPSAVRIVPSSSVDIIEDLPDNWDMGIAALRTFNCT